MKWLLVTTNLRPHQPNTRHPNGAGWNVGDVFAYLGTVELIREVDPDAKIATVNMDDAESITTPQRFDRAVFAGRPMFWRGAETHPLWTELIYGWLCRDPRKVMALGVGDCWPLNDKESELEWRAQAKRAYDRMFAVHVRSFGTTNTLGGVCPSTWILRPAEKRPLRLTNLMKSGGHYPDFSKRASEVWHRCLPAFSGVLLEHGFEFVAHTEEEKSLALRMGWQENAIHLFDNAESYLDIYARAQIYVGNRVHGGLVMCGGPAPVMVFGNDSRLHAVTAAGGAVQHINEASLAEVQRCAETADFTYECVTDRKNRIALHRECARAVLVKFAS